MNADPSSNSPAPTEQQTQPVQQQPSAPPRPTFITDPYGSGATFSWSGSTGVDHIPYVGDPDYVAYTQAVGNWLAQREAFYKTTVQYQKDQAASNPAIASGQIPGVGFTAEAPNAWGIPIGATVTELKPMNGGYQIGYQERGTPQQVTIEGPGYSMSGTVYAKDAQLAAKIALGSAYAQVGGVDVSPSKIGGYVASSGGNQAVVQVGDPARNEYWVSKGLPQYAGYSIPVLTSEQSVEGFYIKEVKANGASPQVITGNKQWESFWSAQGHPELGGYEAPKLESGQYVFNPSVNSQGQLSFGVGNTNWESQWKQLGVTDVNTIRGYAPPTDLATGSYIKNISKSNEGLNFTLGNTITEARLADINAKLDVINAQNKVFVDSYNTGAIKNPLDLQKALTRQNELTIGVLNQAESYGFLSAQDKQENINQLNLSMQSINNLANSYKPTATQTAVPAPLKVYSAFNPNISPLGVDPSNDIVRIAETNMGSSLLVRSDYKVAGKQESIVDGKTVVNYSIVPKISVASVDQAIAAHDLQSNFMQRSGGQQGTRTLGLSEAQYTQFLTPEQKTEYTNALNVRTQGRMIDLATMIASGVAAPSLGVGGAIKAVGISVGLAQAFKTGEYYFTGKEVTQSLLSPKEFVQSTTQGLLIGGVANKSIQVLKIAGSGLAPAIERTAVFGSVGVVSGGVSEFSQTGKVTAEGLAIGGVEGLAFGAVGEGLGGLKGKTQSYIRSSPTGQALQQKLNMSYLDAADAMKLYEPSLSDKIIMKTTGLRPTKPLNIVAAGTDVDIGLLNSGFVKPPESSLSAGERAIAEKALGIKRESMPKGYLEGFTKPPETSLTIEQEVTVRKALGSEANGKPMPPDYAKSFGLDSKATASPELSPDDIKISKMYRKATSDMPEDYVAGFGLESEWKAPAKHVKALPAKDQPNFVSQEFTDMVWNISSQPGSSSIAVERSMDTVGGSSKSNPVRH
jgi:hypothetical protein